MYIKVLININLSSTLLHSILSMKSVFLLNVFATCSSLNNIVTVFNNLTIKIKKPNPARKPEGDKY